MKTKLQTITIILIAALGIWSCSKNDDRDPGKGNDGKGNLPAKLIYTFTRDVYYPDLRTNRQSTYFTFNTYGFNFWDIGRDGQFRLTSEREAGVFDVAQITLIHNSDGTISDEFDYDSPKGSDTNVQVLLSPDNKKVLYSPTLANGIVITDLDGNVLTHLEAVNIQTGPVSLGINDEVLWLPGNRIIFTLDGRYIFRSDPPYKSQNLVKEMSYTQWGNLRVNKQGTQLTLLVDNHIYVMGVDGSDLRQVTESSGGEIHTDFSPDGKHLLIAKKNRPYILLLEPGYYRERRSGV